MFPYFLPCLCVSLLAVIALISCFWLPETLHKHTGGLVVDNSVVRGTDALGNSEAGNVGFLKLFANRPLMSAIIVYCIFSLQDVAYAEAFSLWTVSDKKYGGLSFSTTELGIVLAFSGFLLMIYQFVIYPYISKWVKPVTYVRIVAVLTVPLLSSYAFMPALSGLTLKFVVTIASFLKTTFTVTTITVLNILMNDAVTQDVRAQANAIAVTLMSIAKSIAPAAAGAIFSWSQKRQTASFLPGDHLVFFMLNVITFIGFVFTFRPFLVTSNTNH